MFHADVIMAAACPTCNILKADDDAGVHLVGKSGGSHFGEPSSVRFVRGLNSEKAAEAWEADETGVNMVVRSVARLVTAAASLLHSAVHAPSASIRDGGQFHEGGYRPRPI